MKKITSIVLIVAMLLLSVSPIYANMSLDAEDMYELSNTAVFKKNGHGELELTTLNQISVLGNSDEYVVAHKTNDSEIFDIGNNKYAIHAYDDIYTLVDEVIIDVDSINDSLYAEYNLSNEMIDDIEKTINEQEALGNISFEMSLFVPCVVETNEYYSVNGQTTTETSNYYYNGQKYQDVMVKYWNCKAGPVVKNGTNALNVAKSFGSFVVSAVGTVSSTISAFSLGLSAYDAYVAACGPVQYGSNSDFIDTYVTYDKITKTTKIDYQGTLQGSVTTYKVWFNQNVTRQYYSDYGTDETIRYTINEIKYSANYQDAAKKCWEVFPMNHYDDPIKITIHGTTCIL